MHYGNNMIHYGFASVKNAVLVRSEKLIVVTVLKTFGSPKALRKKGAELYTHRYVDSKRACNDSVGMILIVVAS